MSDTVVTPPVRLVLADDHPLMLQALLALVANEAQPAGGGHRQ